MNLYWQSMHNFGSVNAYTCNLKTWIFVLRISVHECDVVRNLHKTNNTFLRIKHILWSDELSKSFRLYERACIEDKIDKNTFYGINLIIVQNFNFPNNKKWFCAENGSTTFQYNLII